MRISFEIATAQQYELKALREKVARFESGEEIVRVRESYEKEIRELGRIIKALKKELSEERALHSKMRDKWFEASDDLEKEYRKRLDAKDREIGKLEKRLASMARALEEEKAKKREKQLELYAALTQLEEAQGKIRKLTAQVNKDFENSSLPSSLQGPKRKKIVNSRERSGRKPGGQPGHKGAGRKKRTPTKKVRLEVPEEYLTDGYYKTGKTVTKQVILLRVGIEVIEYTADICRNRKTGARVHAKFPEGVTDDVNYDGTVKAFLHLLCTECNVSLEKAKRFLKELTAGGLDVSTGMISGLCREFSGKTGEEKAELLRKLLGSPVMNADFTNANVNGKSAQVLILASPSVPAALFIGKEQKGHKGIAGTPLENYAGTVVHDHDTTFYAYGVRHQECQQHNLRYLKGSIENEPERRWNVKMQGLLRRMLHYRNSLTENGIDPEIVEKFEAEYDGILKEAQREYEDEPPNEYYRDGYNLYLRLKNYRESQLLFLHDKAVPANNSLCERNARVYKRKQKQAMVFRSEESFLALCDALSIVYSMRAEGKDIYGETTKIFNRSSGENPHRFKKRPVQA